MQEHFHLISWILPPVWCQQHRSHSMHQIKLFKYYFHLFIIIIYYYNLFINNNYVLLFSPKFKLNLNWNLKKIFNSILIGAIRTLVQTDCWWMFRHETPLNITWTCSVKTVLSSVHSTTQRNLHNTMKRSWNTTKLAQHNRNMLQHH